jgi:non-heme chloroperoxidase
MPVVARSVEVNGAELTYFEEGAGVPVILIGGFLNDYRSWRRQNEALRAQYRVLALSQRYYWPNKWPDDGTGFSVVTHVADLAALHRKLDLQLVHLIGHSYGGGVAARFAAEHPSLVRSLVLAEPAVATVALDEPPMLALMAAFGEHRKTVFDEWRKGDRAKAVDEELRYVFGKETLDRIRDEHLDIINDNADLIGAGSLPRPPPPPFTSESAQRLTMPVLLIEGASTKPIFHITCEKLASCLPDVQRIILPNTTHALCLESPDAFGEAVLKFLNRH